MTDAPTPQPAGPSPEIRLFDGTPLSEEQLAVHATLTERVHAAAYTGTAPELGGKKQAEAAAGAALLKRPAGDPAGESARSFAFDLKCLRRYLVAFKWELDASLEAVLATVAWREETVPKTLPEWRAHEACVNTRYMEWIGHDERGQPILLIRSRNADLDISREDRAAFLVWTLEYATRFLMDETRGVERWCIIIDETSKEWKHTDNSFLSSVTPVVFSNFVERLNKAIIVNPATLTSAAISVVRFFLDERTKNKFVAVHGTKVETGAPGDPAQDRDIPRKSYTVPELSEAFGAANVPSYLGGTLPLESLDDYKARIDAAQQRQPSAPNKDQQQTPPAAAADS